MKMKIKIELKIIYITNFIYLVNNSLINFNAVNSILKFYLIFILDFMCCNQRYEETKRNVIYFHLTH